MSRVAHEDRGLDLGKSRSRNGDRGIGDALVRIAAAAECVVKDLAALGVADDDELGVGTLLVERIHGAGNGFDTCGRGLRVALPAAAGLTSAGWVVDCFGCGAGVGS